MSINKNGSKRLIVVRHAWDHSNRLYQSANYEAFCLEYGICYVNHTFKDMAKYYEGCPRCSPIFYVLNKVFSIRYVGHILMKLGLSKERFSILDVLKKLNLIQLEYCNSFRGDHIIDYTDVLLEGFKQSSTVYVLGWAMWDSLMKKHRGTIAHKYRLKEKYRKGNALANKILALKEQRVVVGVHIRRRNYAIFMDGIYYYSDSDYIKIMSNVKRVIPSSCAFVIFSDEPVAFEETDSLLISKEPWYIDHHLMTQCDYLVGPPSTFTGWASFVGGIGCCHVKDINAEIQLDDFIIRTN